MIQYKEVSVQSQVIQRAEVAGFHDDRKSSVEIGAEIHKIVQEQFIDVEQLWKYQRYIEFEINGRCVNIRGFVDIEEEQGNGSPLLENERQSCLLIGAECIRIVK